MSLGDLIFYPSAAVIIIAAFVLAFVVSPPFLLLAVFAVPLYAFTVWLDERELPTRTLVILPNPEGAVANNRYGPSVAGPNTRGQTLMFVPVTRRERQSLRSRRSKRKTPN